MAYVINNSAEADLDRTITWQFDNAVKLIAVIGMLKDFAGSAIEDFWDAHGSDIASIDTANDFGLSVWGKILNLERPTILVEESEVSISTSLYRKLLKARFKLLNSKASMPDYVAYVSEVFDGECSVLDNLNMSMSFSVSESADEEISALAAQKPQVVFLFPAGVNDGTDAADPIFGLDGQQKASASDHEIGGLDDSTFNWR